MSSLMDTGGSDESHDEIVVYKAPLSVRYKGKELQLAAIPVNQPQTRRALTTWAYDELSKAGKKGTFPKQVLQLMSAINAKSVPHLINLRVDTDTNQPVLIRVDRSHYANGVVVALFGEAMEPCQHCENGVGPFKACSLVEYGNWGCSNCEYTQVARGGCSHVAEKQGKQGISKMERAIIKAAKEIPPDAAKSVMNLLEAIQTARSSGGFTN